MSAFERPIDILLVDAEPADVELMHQSLELVGLTAKLRAASSGDEALSILWREGTYANTPRPDIVLLDLELPDLTGIEVLGEIRSDAELKKIPVIVYGHSASTDDRSAARELGVDQVLDKPTEAGGFFGLVSAIKFYWMARAPSLAPPPMPGPHTSARPRAMSGIDLMGLPIEPVEAYVLSVLDGELGVEEISMVVGTPARETREMLSRLADLGAVSWNRPHPSLAPPPPPPPPEPVSVAEPEPEPEEPDDGRKTLGADRKRVIDETHEMLGESNYYELLGVETDATKTEIRTAYFLLAKIYHPDTLFNWNLGPYKRKMEQVFKHLTEAYETLGKNKRRRKYDAYLGIVEKTKPLERALSMPPPTGLQTDGTLGTADTLPEGAAAIPPQAVPIIERKPVSAPAPVIERVAVEPLPPLREPRFTTAESRQKRARVGQRRIEALLGKRSGSGAQEPVPAPDARTAVSALAQSLNQVSAITGGRDRATQLIEDARAADSEGNLTAAANAMRLALTWRPDDPVLQEECERMQQAALAANAQRYEDRARYEEEHSMWKDAALSWARVAKGRPNDSTSSRQAAVALLRSDGDVKEAVQYARRSTQQAPQDVRGHVVLAEAYLTAGMTESARRPLKRALELDPDHERARAMLREI